MPSIGITNQGGAGRLKSSIKAASSARSSTRAPITADEARPGYDGHVPDHDPDALLADLDPAQREAVLITSGPLCILAGAGSGKTRVISRRVGYALATGVVRPRDVLVVTFTDKAAGEMRTRLAALGQPGVAASTFHAAALRQLRHFWPRVHGSDPPSILESKVPILAPLAAGLPGGYRFLAVRDLAGEIEWAKARRIRPNDYETRAIEDERDASLPPDLMATLYRRYETAKARAGRIDFEDMLELTIGLIEADDAIAAEVRDRYRWFSVDEYQDTNPLQAALLDAWLGGRQDLAVVGDEDQTIYTFTGATSDYLIGFEERYPDARVVRLETNYRSTPEVLALANSVLAAGRSAPDERLPGVAPRPPKRLVASNDSGPRPEIGGFATDEAELAGITAAIRALARAGTAARRDGDPGPNERAAARDRGRARGGRDPVPRSRRAILRPTGGPPRDASRRPACPRRERRRAGHPTRDRIRARTRRPPRHRARRRGRRGTSRRGRHAPGARRGPGPGPTRRRMCRRSSPKWSGGPRSRPAGPRPASSS